MMPLEEAHIPTETVMAPYIRVSFPVQGRYLPADHGYVLHAALTTRVPDLHGASWLGVELISGLPWAPGVIALPARGASLHLRLPAEKFDSVLPLAGARFEIENYPIRLGLPQVAAL